MKLTTVLITGLLFMGACHSEQKDSKEGQALTKSQPKMDIEAIKKQLILQQGMDTLDHPGIKDYYLQAIDIDLSIQVINEGLSNAGYVAPERAAFDQHIKELYHFENKDQKNWKGLTFNMEDMVESWKSGPDFIKSYAENSETENDYYHMVAFGQYNFVFEITPLRKLISIGQNGDYKITLPPYLLERNNYLFHQSKSAKDYMIQHDKAFVTALVVRFGYDHEPEFNAVALAPYHTGTKEDEGIASVVFHNLQGPGAVQVRKGILSYIGNHTDQNDNKMYAALERFVFGVHDEGKFPEVSFGDKCKMLAYTGALGEKLQNKYMEKNPNIWSVHTLLTDFKIHYPKFIEEIKKQNYFNEPDIKVAVTSAEEEAHSASLHADPE